MFVICFTNIATAMLIQHNYKLKPMSSQIKLNLETVRKDIPDNVTLVAVSKFHPVNELMQAYEYGERVFGESKVQELTDKYESLPKDINWHFIGHLQTNKVKYITPFISLIHSVDSIKLLTEIDKSGAKNDRVIDVLIQIHVAQEETKYGFSADEVVNTLKESDIYNLKNIRLRGIMGMATFTDNELQIRNEFRILNNVFLTLKSEFFADKEYFNIKSYGMSDDYKIAIEEGSNMVRVGSKIFGVRNY